MKKFEMRSIEIEGAEPACIGTFDCERQARLQVNEDKYVDSLLDFFSTDSCKFMILQHKSKAKLSLSSFVRQYYENRAGAVSSLRRLDFACSTLGSLCAALARFQKQRVVHRQINTESIKFRISESKKQYKIAKIDSFDLAIELKEKYSKIIQELSANGSNLLAPEIQQGAPHDYSADVWALGQVAYQIMSIPRKEYEPLTDIYARDAMWLEEVPDAYKRLVGLMIQEEPSSRPTAAQLLQTPLIREFR